MRILAFNVAHDSSVCVINNGKVEFFCKEERLSRIKRDKAPFKALELLRSLNLGKIDYALYSVPSNDQPDLYYIYSRYIEKTFGLPLENFSYLTHHISHAALAYYNSGYIDALVFVVDRNGSILFVNGIDAARESESVFMCNDDREFIPIYKSFWLTNDNDSLKPSIYNTLRHIYQSDCDLEAETKYGIVKVYEAATTLIGQHVLENGKTMGLSSYGKTEESFYKDNLPVSSLFTHSNENYVYFANLTDKVNGDITKDNYNFYANKAKQVQIDTQNQVLRLLKKYIHKTGIKNVCLVGGYALNVVANNFYVKNLPDVNFYFEPVADDTGVSIGAAMLKYRMIESNDNTIHAQKDNFYHYYDDTEKIDKGTSADLNTLCKILTEQKSLAIFDGSPEAGPRALGHRSILFDPRNKGGKDIVNLIKKREWYRPFAGIILKSYFKEYFDTDGLDESKFMTVNFFAKEKTIDLVPSICHVDKSCRIQTIDESDTFLYSLLAKFHETTGCPMLLNTSFNLAGEPLVQTKADAINTFYNSALDALYFVNDNKLIIK